MKQLIAFDMDGTLINSLGVTIEVLANTMETILGEKPTREDIVKHFGVSEEKIFANLFGPEEGERINTLYNEFFRKEVHRTNLFDDIFELLQGLSVNPNLTLALYTARGRGTTDILLEHHRIAPFFKVVLTGTDVSNGKPHPEGLLAIKSRLGLGEVPMTYIGDSHKDIEMAHAVGALSIGVHWCPLVDREKLAASAPKHMFGVPSELRSFYLSPLSS